MLIWRTFLSTKSATSDGILLSLLLIVIPCFWLPTVLFHMYWPLSQRFYIFSLNIVSFSQTTTNKTYTFYIPGLNLITWKKPFLGQLDNFVGKSAWHHVLRFWVYSCDGRKELDLQGFHMVSTCVLWYVSTFLPNHKWLNKFGLREVLLD